jgi:hypothetical protein
MPFRKVCKHCGDIEEAHHDYEPTMPDDCVCRPDEWGEIITDVCHEYQEQTGPFSEKGRCAKCEHDEACHKAPNVI